MKKFLLALLVIVALAAGAIGGYIFRGTQAQSPQATTSTTTTQNSSTTNTGSSATTENGRCTAAALTATVTLPDGGAAAGNRYYNVKVTNNANITCTINGYPGVSLTDSTGAQVGLPADKDTTNAATDISLSNGQSATATVKLGVSENYPDGTCKGGVANVKIYPPNDTGFLTAPTDITSWCPGFTTTAFVKS